MAGYKIHLIAGAAVPIAVSYALDDINWALTIGVLSSSFGALIPDIDADYSKIRHMLPKVAKLYDKLPKNMIFKHRGVLTHSVVTLIPLVYLYYLWSNWVTLGLLMGVFSHHLVDGLSPKGLPRYFLF